jgi:hypothetical protein
VARESLVVIVTICDASGLVGVATTMSSVDSWLAGLGVHSRVKGAWLGVDFGAEVGCVGEVVGVREEGVDAEAPHEDADKPVDAGAGSDQ